MIWEIPLSLNKTTKPTFPNTLVLEWIWHKLNYFLFCGIFEILFNICA